MVAHWRSSGGSESVVGDRKRTFVGSWGSAACNLLEKGVALPSLDLGVLSEALNMPDVELDKLFDAILASTCLFQTGLCFAAVD